MGPLNANGTCAGQFKDSQPRDKELSCKVMAKNTKVNLLMAFLRSRHLLLERQESTKELFRRVSPKVKVTFFFQTAEAIKARSKMSSSTRGILKWLMGANTLANLLMINWMELEAFNGLMGAHITAISNNKLDGRGIYRWPDGKRYEGELNDGVPNGSGAFLPKW